VTRIPKLQSATANRIRNGDLSLQTHKMIGIP